MVTPICDTCQQPIGYHKRPHRRPAAHDGNCEVCTRKAWAETVFDTPTAPGKAANTRLAKARHTQTLILRDGRAYNPAAPRHGTSTAYTGYSCKCPACLEWHRQYTIQYKKAAA